MLSRNLRTLALASFLTTSLVAWSGCNTENADGTKNALGKTEDKAKELEKKAAEEAKAALKKTEEEAKIALDKAKEAGKTAADAVGKEMEKEGKALQGLAKPTTGETPK